MRIDPLLSLLVLTIKSINILFFLAGGVFLTELIFKGGILYTDSILVYPYIKVTAHFNLD